eukprot:5789275-Alexandrium_andersonii.AAC.1
MKIFQVSDSDAAGAALRADPPLPKSAVQGAPNYVNSLCKKSGRRKWCSGLRTCSRATGPIACAISLRRKRA